MGEKNCVTFIWKICNFLESECVESPEFYVDALRESGWILRLNIPSPYSAKITVDLENKYYKDLEPLRIDYEVLILAATPLNSVTCVERNVLCIPDTYHRTSEYLLQEIFSKSNEDLCPEDVLTIQCKLWKLDKGEALTPLFYQAYTRLGIRKFSLHWPLKFKSLHKGETQTRKFFLGPDQPIFKVETLISDFQVKQLLPLRGYKKYRNLEFLIEQQNKDFEELELSCRISVLDKSGNIATWRQNSLYLKSGETLVVNRLICINFLKLNKKTYITNNELKLLFDFTLYEDDYSVVESISEFPSQTNSCPESTRNSQSLGTSEKTTVDAYISPEIKLFSTSKSLKDDLYDMYLTNSCSDVVLEAEDISFPCHKCILSARSPILSSLLSESTTYTTELKASTLSSLLQFLYTGDIGTALDLQFALELYEAANNFRVLSLKNVCSEFLEVNMTDQNVCEILIVSSKHQDSVMRKKTENFILKKHANIISSDKWRSLVKNEAKHIVETMHRICLEKAITSSFLFNPSLDNAISFDIETSALEHKSNFWCIYQSSMFSDFELRTNGKTYAMHKNILWARSPVFKAMLSLKESSKNVLDIPDVDDPTMERLIRFIYSGKIEVTELAEISKLYCAADKYQILSLKNWCSKSLVQELSIENVCEILILSHQRGDEKFKDEVLNFLTKNDESVILSVEWKKLMKSDPLLASEAMYQIYAKKTNANTANSETDPEKSPQHLESNQQFVISDSDAVAIMQVEFISLYEEKFLSDCKLCTDDRSFEVHKNILCARSPVFNAMFSSNLEEATTNTLVIPDIDGQTTDQMLRYVYTGTLEDTESVDLCKLYYAADKYQINSLRNWCSHLLSEKISVENVCEILLLANRHGDISLETAVQSFLIKNRKEVFNSDSWKTFMSTEPQVSCQTMLTIY